MQVICQMRAHSLTSPRFHRSHTAPRDIRGMAPRSPWARPGLTVIEVLVAIAIIGVLLSLVIPAVQQSREAARSLECRNRLKQIGIAVQSFASGHHSMLPRPTNSGICFPTLITRLFTSSWWFTGRHD
jgi:prepilin-type N-terminal cleavage/methylation domain-containing protein